MSSYSLILVHTTVSVLPKLSIQYTAYMLSHGGLCTMHPVHPVLQYMIMLAFSIRLNIPKEPKLPDTCTLVKQTDENSCTNISSDFCNESVLL